METLIKELIAARDNAKQRYRHAVATGYKPGEAMYGNELTTLNTLLTTACDSGLVTAEQAWTE